MATKVLMVCLGNICRSPLAEGILKSKVNQDLIYVDSAGTGGFHIGERPDSRSIAVAKKYGIDISSQRCRRFIREDFQKFDVIYVMDQSNYTNILKLASTSDEKQKVRLLLDGVNAHTREVPDPYFGGEMGFENVFRLIDMACNLIARDLTKTKNNHEES